MCDAAGEGSRSLRYKSEVLLWRGGTWIGRGQAMMPWLSATRGWLCAGHGAGRLMRNPQAFGGGAVIAPILQMRNGVPTSRWWWVVELEHTPCSVTLSPSTCGPCRGILLSGLWIDIQGWVRLGLLGCPCQVLSAPGCYTGLK